MRTQSENNHAPSGAPRGKGFQATSVAALGAPEGVVASMNQPTKKKIQFRFALHVEFPDGGSLEVPPEQWELFQKDPDAFIAQTFDLSPATLKAWLQHYQDQGECCGKTRAGGKCQRRATQAYPSITRFVDGESNRCHAHQSPSPAWKGGNDGR